ncbi:MAG TPA: hypothetical protein VM943_05135 [Pyrinomonadaceae bacterium]|nr:hypothetical protein [Pyrinomonadaceae bacterium]
MPNDTCRDVREDSRQRLGLKYFIENEAQALYWYVTAALRLGPEKMMLKEISEVIGEDRTGLPVYRALRPLLCRDCGEGIAEGALFTRWPLAADGFRILPRCRKCVPLELPEDVERKQSGMLQALLSTPPEDNPAPATQQKQKVDEEINKRLSPALARTRRTRVK